MRGRRVGTVRLVVILVASAAAVALVLPVPAALARFAPPAGAGASSASPSDGAAAPFHAAEAWRDQVLYFVMLDRFADGDTTNNVAVDRSSRGAFHGGDLAGLRRHLDEIAGLGATAIWITPVVKNIDSFVTGAGFPDWAYHGYWADDLHRLDPRFGTEAELRGLVDDCRARGLRVLLDVVYNHVGYGSRYLSDPQTKAWLRSNETGTCGQDDLTSCVSGLPDWKTELPEAADYVLGAQIEIIRRSGVDGLRIDTFKHLDHPFWRDHRERTRSAFGPGFFLLGEVWGGDPRVMDPWFAADEVDAGFDFGFQGSTVGFLLGRGRTIAYDKYLKSRERIRPGYLVAHFLSTHDVPGSYFQLNYERELFRLAAVLQFTCAGLPVICWGDEVGRRGGDWPDNRGDMPWGERPILPGRGLSRDEALRDDYRKLIAIRRAHRSLTHGVHQGLSTAGDLLVFQRADSTSGDVVLVAVNRGATPAEATVPRPAGWEGARIEDAWNGQEVHDPAATGAAGDSLLIRTEAKSARILVAAPRREGGR